jgi:hypothetical protein
MPFFKTTNNIFKNPWEDDLFNSNWMDSNKIILPPKTNWDYSRELQIEDVDIWEQIYYESGGLALYAAWSPYAEFYLITHRFFTNTQNSIETFYGANSGKNAYKRAKELGMPIKTNQVWAENEDMWLYKSENSKKLLK